MTFEQTKDFLRQYKHQERLTLKLMAEVNNINVTYGAIQSPLSHLGEARSTSNSYGIEKLIDWASRKKQALSRAIDEFKAIEDRLSNAVNQLPALEQSVIIGYYMQEQTHYQLAMELNYCEQHIRRLKNNAIGLLSNLL